MGIRNTHFQVCRLPPRRVSSEGHHDWSASGGSTDYARSVQLTPDGGATMNADASHRFPCVAYGNFALLRLAGATSARAQGGLLPSLRPRRV